MRAYEIRAGSTSIDGLHKVKRPDPEPRDHQILIRVRAASLNSRDQAILRGKDFHGVLKRDTIPLSDGAGEVIATGRDVTRFKVGDRVAGTFFQGWIDGLPPPDRAALGSPLDGMLAEYIVLHEDGAVAIPERLSFEEAGTLPCAALTAWNALISTGTPVKSGDTVLCLGTGGVSMFAVEFAKSTGARVILTSSNDDKLQRAKDQHEIFAGINYKTCIDWGKQVYELTGGAGAVHIIEVGGSATLRQSCQAVAQGGKIALIGFLAGAAGGFSPLHLMMRNASMHGVSVGSRALFEQMNQAIEVNGIKPPIDKIFGFDEAHQAFRYQADGKFMGKIVIAI